MALTFKVKLVTVFMLGCYWLDRQPRAFFTADILICHSRRSTGVTNNMSKGFCRRQPACTESDPESEQPSIIVLFIPELSLL